MQTPLSFAGDRRTRITFLGNAVTDLMVHTEDSQFAAFGMQKQKDQSVTADFAKSIELLGIAPQSLCGGSLANTAYTLARLGGDVALISSLSDDFHGKAYAAEMQEAGVDVAINSPGSVSQTAYVFVTPDGERTFAWPPYSTRITAAIVQKCESIIAQSKLLVVEGYLLIDQHDAVDAAIALARKHNVKVALTLAAPSVVKNNHAHFAKYIQDGVDLIVANIQEMGNLLNGDFPAADLLRGKTTDASSPLTAIINQTPRIITSGAKGVYFNTLDDNLFVMAERVPRVVDTTGAGDAFLGGFLAVWDGRFESARQAIEKGQFIARKVIQNFGPRLLPTAESANPYVD